MNEAGGMTVVNLHFRAMDIRGLEVKWLQARGQETWPVACLFQYGCALVHKARSIKTWSRTFGVDELDWPAQTLDLNPIEHLQNELERRLRARPSCQTSVCELTNGRMVKNSLKHTPKLCGTPSQKSWSCYSCKGWTDVILNPMN